MLSTKENSKQYLTREPKSVSSLRRTFTR